MRVSFGVRNDDPVDPVVALRVELPTARPLEGVSVPPVPGWQVTVSPGSVEWRGGPVGAEPVELAMIVGRMPQGAGPVRFRVLQTSRSGTVVEWSDRSVPGAPAPAYRSLVLPFGVPEPAVPVQPHDHGRQARDAAGALPDVAGPGSAGWTIGGALTVAAVLAALAGWLGRRQRARFAALTGQEPPGEEAPAARASAREVRDPEAGD